MKAPLRATFVYTCQTHFRATTWAHSHEEGEVVKGEKKSVNLFKELYTLSGNDLRQLLNMVKIYPEEIDGKSVWKRRSFEWSDLLRSRWRGPVRKDDAVIASKRKRYQLEIEKKLLLGWFDDAVYLLLKSNGKILVRFEMNVNRPQPCGYRHILSLNYDVNH